MPALQNRGLGASINDLGLKLITIQRFLNRELRSRHGSARTFEQKNEICKQQPKLKIDCIVVRTCMEATFF